MAIVALIVTLAGATFSVIGAFWLLFGFSPKNPRYTDDGGLYPGMQVSKVVPNLLADQRKVAALIAFGAAVQMVGGVLAILAFLDAR